MTKDLPPPDEPPAGLVLYTLPDGSARLQLRIQHETLWLTQRQLAELFQKDVRTINEHIQNIISEGELPPEATIRKFRIVQAEGSRTVERLIDHYSLDVVIAVGYRVRSTRGTQFRQWATATLREYLTKGFAIDGRTAAEIVTERADAAKPHMGLTTWNNAPAGPIRKADVGIAKNYLTHEEMAALNRVVTMYLDYAEDQAVRQQPMHMADWVRKLDAFLEFNERNILSHAGRVSADIAKQHAEQEFAKHEDAIRIREAIEPTSDFDKAVERIKRLEQPPAKPPPAKRAKKAARKRHGQRRRDDES